MKGHSLWQILGRDLPIRVKFLVINFLVMATTLIVSAILILRASTAVRENTLSAEKALITQSANTLSATVDEVSTISETITSFPFLNQLIYSDNVAEFLAREDTSIYASDFFNTISSLKDTQIVTDIRIYLSEDFEYVYNSYDRSNLFLPISDIQGGYWFGIFAGQPTLNQLWCPSFYLTKHEIKENGSLAFIKRLGGRNQSGMSDAYIVVYFSQNTLTDIMRQRENNSNTIYYLINSRDSLVAATDEAAAGLYNLSYVNIPEKIGSDEDFRKVVILKQSLLMAYRPIREADWRLVVSIPESDITSAEREVLIRQFWIYLFITALALAIEFILSTSLTTRLTDLSSKMTVHPADEQAGPLEKLPDTKDRDEIGQLAGTYNRMIDQIETLMDEQAATADQLRVTEVRALQAQINPHFLYNMLDMINWMALSGSGKEVSDAVQNLSKFYRLSLSKKEIYVTIEDELRHIDLYVLLQNMRFDDKIDFIIDVPDEIMECSIPKLVLQPIIENALLHGILEKNTREGTVVVMAWEEMNEVSGKEDIVFTISDDGVGMSKEKLRELNESLKNAETRTKSSTVEKETAAGESAIVNGSGIAVTNTHLRLVLLYGHGYGLTFRSEEGSGTEVEVRIPKQTGVTR